MAAQFFSWEQWLDFRLLCASRTWGFNKWTAPMHDLRRCRAWQQTEIGSAKGNLQSPICPWCLASKRNAGWADHQFHVSVIFRNLATLSDCSGWAGRMLVSLSPAQSLFFHCKSAKKRHPWGARRQSPGITARQEDCKNWAETALTLVLLMTACKNVALAGSYLNLLRSFWICNYWELSCRRQLTVMIIIRWPDMLKWMVKPEGCFREQSISNNMAMMEEISCPLVQAFETIKLAFRLHKNRF